MTTFRRWSLRSLMPLAPVAFLATGACVATRNDVRILQQDLAVMRAERAQGDSARDRQLALVQANLQQVSDSMRVLSARLVRGQGDVLDNQVKILQQLIQVQELTGQSQRVVRELRAELERRAEQAEAAPPAAGTPAAPGTTPPAGGAAPAGAAPATSTGPGPTQLYELATAQLRRGSAGTAREGFEQLLAQYPQSDLAPDAQFYIGETYAAERKVAQADSAYRLVVERWPNAPRSATALYKLGLSLARQGKNREARAALNDVVTRYPRSDEAELARERLRTLPQ